MTTLEWLIIAIAILIVLAVVVAVVKSEGGEALDLAMELID